MTASSRNWIGLPSRPSILLSQVHHLGPSQTSLAGKCWYTWSRSWIAAFLIMTLGSSIIPEKHMYNWTANHLAFSFFSLSYFSVFYFDISLSVLVHATNNTSNRLKSQWSQSRRVPKGRLRPCADNNQLVPRKLLPTWPADFISQSVVEKPGGNRHCPGLFHLLLHPPIWRRSARCARGIVSPFNQHSCGLIPLRIREKETLKYIWMILTLLLDIYSWNFNFFFFNKSLKRIVFFMCRSIK